MSRPGSDSESEADDLESLVHSLSIRVEYYRSFEYCLKWEESMYSKRSSKASKKSHQRSPSPKEDDIQRKLKGKKRQKKTKAGDGAVNTNKLSSRDLIDIISDTHDAEPLAEEVEGKSVEVADTAVDESDEDRVSVSSSVASGPSSFCPTNIKRWSSLQDLCSACQKLYQRAEKMKTPIKGKDLDNDPNSLTSDHWVLIKRGRTRRLPNARGKLLTHVKLVKKRLKSGVKQSKMYEGQSSACWRPRIFLQRNLRCCVGVPAKKGRQRKNRRKRARGDSQGPRAAKQRRLNSNSPRQHLSRSRTRGSSPQPISSLSSSPALERRGDRRGDNQTTVEVIPCTVRLETLKMKDLPSEKKTPDKSGFVKLLSQLRGGNSSRIVREKCFQWPRTHLVLTSVLRDPITSGQRQVRVFTSECPGT